MTTTCQMQIIPHNPHDHICACIHVSKQCKQNNSSVLFIHIMKNIKKYLFF